MQRPTYALAFWTVCDDTRTERLSDVRPYRSPRAIATIARRLNARHTDPCSGWALVERSPFGWRYAD